MHSPDQFDGYVGGARDTRAQGRQLALVFDRQQRVIQRGRAGQHDDPLGCNEFHDTVDVEDRHRDHRRSADERRDQPGLVPERMEVRVDHEIAVALAQVGELTPFSVEAKVLAVIHHHALGPAGGARRIYGVGDVVAAHIARTANRWKGSRTSGPRPARLRVLCSPGRGNLSESGPPLHRCVR